MRILIIGKKSFIAQNFINRYSHKINFFYFDKYFSSNYKKFLKEINLFVNRKKISHIINFIGNNDNSLLSNNETNILRDNFILPLSLVDLFKEKKINFTFFLSSEINKIENPDKNNIYALSKFFLEDSLKFVVIKNKISLIKIDNIYGPYDLNFNRLIPSLMLKLLLKKKIKINLNQRKSLIYVKNLLPIILRTLKNKKTINMVNVKGEKIDILKLWKIINRMSVDKSKKNKNDINRNFAETLDWYKNNTSVLKTNAKKYYKNLFY
tara:strand:- start:368 stop:1165 length:798 start_codon:yes stop_codon:yes gene_type:complete